MSVIRARGVDIDTLEGRSLIRGLTLELGRERVAMVGRNGVGKSTLLRVLAGEAPARGRVWVTGTVAYVPQDPPGVGSPGERRLRAIRDAFAGRPDLVLLDEPTEDLDRVGREALFVALEAFEGGVVAVTHDRELLERFEHFFVVEESGCRVLHGAFERLAEDRRASAEREQERYARRLRNLEAEERKHARVVRRRERKAAVGRLHEIDRNQARIRLNTRRSLAQVSQARVRAGAEARIEARRAWARLARRALQVKLPLSAAVPEPAALVGAPLVAEGLVAARGDVVLAPLDLSVRTERIALEGPNGSGKTTLLETLVGERPPRSGRVRLERTRIGYVGQGGSNWRRDESLTEVLTRFVDPERAVQHIAAHRFPLALAHRALRTLSPGERTRAALVALFARESLDVLVLDEPTRSVDIDGVSALTEALGRWRGGLLVASHDAVFLDAIGVDRRIAVASGAEMGGPEDPVRSAAERSAEGSA